MLSKIKGALRQQVRNYGLKGDNVHCFCCNNDFVTFLPGGTSQKRPNALCPVCSSLERHRLIWRYLTTKTDLFKKNTRLLHVAPERLFYKVFSNYQNIDYVPCAKFGIGYTDQYPPGTQNIDLTDISFSDNSFDVIICSHVLEHIPDDYQAMGELFRVLKRGGWAILQVPLDSSRETTYEDDSIIAPEKREEAFGQYDHVRVYGNDYGERLRKAGFQVKQDKFAYEFSPAEQFKYGLISEDIYFCSKPL